MNLYRNPFLMALWAPLYLVVGAMAITNDFLMGIMYIMFTVGIIGAYVSEFPMLPSLYMNEMVHKTSISSLLGMLAGMLIGIMFIGGSGPADSAPISTQGKFLVTWGVMSVPAYLLMVFLVIGVNKRDLEAEQAVREEKKKKNKSSGPPIMDDRDGF